MASSNASWGIEIGSNAIKALKLELDGDKTTVADVAVIPHKVVLSTPEINQDDAVRLALGTLMSQYDLSGASVCMSVPGHTAFARFAKLPPVEPKKVGEIVKYEAVQQIPFPIEEVEWDYQTFVSPDSPDVEVGIFAMTKEKVRERLEMYADVHLTPDVLTLSPVAVYNAVAYDLQFDETTPGTILLDIGTTSSDLIIAEAGRVWIRTFPIGGHHFTEALVEAFQASYAKAEKLKKEAENPKHSRQLLQAMRPVFQDLAQDVQRSIGYYESLHKDADLKRLIGMGSTFRLPGLRKFLKQQLQMDVYRLEQFKQLSLEGPQAGEFQAATLNLVTAYGLALQGLSQEGRSLSSLEANLMPKTVLRTAMWHKKTKWFGMAAAVAIAAGGSLFLRPFLDGQAIAGAPEPAIIQTVIADGNRLKSAANEAGVTATSTPDYTAANMIALMESRGVYQHLVRDLGQMFASAQARAGNWAEQQGQADQADSQGFRLRAYATDYMPPPSANTGRGGRSGRGGQDAGASAGTAQPRLQISLTATTNQPEPQKFMLETLDAWLRANRERPDVPYRIILGPGGVDWNINLTTIQGDGREAAPGRVDPGRQIAIDPRRQEQNRGGHGEGGHGIVGEFERPSAFVGASESARLQRGQPGNSSLDQLAPLGPPPNAPEPGTQVATFTLNWIVELVPAKDDGGDS